MGALPYTHNCYLYNVILSGTCYSSWECDDKNGEASGNCASGFGRCCVSKFHIHILKYITTVNEIALKDFRNKWNSI